MVYINEERRRIYSRRFYFDDFSNLQPEPGDKAQGQIPPPKFLQLYDEILKRPNTAGRIKMSRAITSKAIELAELYSIDCDIYQYERKVMVELMFRNIPYFGGATEILSGMLALCDYAWFRPVPDGSDHCAVLDIEIYYYDCR